MGSWTTEIDHLARYGASSTDHATCHAIFTAKTALQWNRNLTEHISDSLRRRLAEMCSVRFLFHWLPGPPGLPALYNGDAAACGEPPLISFLISGVASDQKGH